MARGLRTRYKIFNVLVTSTRQQRGVLKDRRQTNKSMQSGSDSKGGGGSQETQVGRALARGGVMPSRRPVILWKGELGLLA